MSVLIDEAPRPADTLPNGSGGNAADDKKRKRLYLLVMLLELVSALALFNNPTVYKYVGGIYEQVGAFVFTAIEKSQDGSLLAFSAGGLIVMILIAAGFVGYAIGLRQRD